jgi:hypothetical protein
MVLSSVKDIPVNTVDLIDNPHAPDLYADSTSGLFLANDNVRITLETARANHATMPGVIARVVVGRVVMPVAAAEKLARALLKFLEDKKAKSSATPQSISTLQ